MQPKANIVHLPVYQPGKPIEDVKRELGLDEVIKLASNENPLGPSPKAKEAMRQELESLSIYPDGAAVELTAAVAEHLQVEPNQIIFGTGSDEVILMLCRAYLTPADETIMASHTFSQYRHNAEVEGAKIVTVPMMNGTHDLDAMRAEVNERTKIIWICNPNNPTGTLVSLEAITEFMNQVPSHVMVVLDEAYYEYVLPEDYGNSLELLKEYHNLIILRTFSKLYGLASLRVGYGVAHPDLIHNINLVRPPFNTSRMAQVAATAAIRDQEYAQYCKDINIQGLKYLQNEFDRLKLNHLPAYGNFIMVDVDRPAAPVFNGLLNRGFIVRGGHQLDFPTSIRVTVGNLEQNEKFIRAFEQVLNETAVKA